MTTLVLLAGLPWLATTLAWPSVDVSLLSWQVHLRSGRLPAGVATAALIVALWALWALHLMALVAEAVAILRRRPLSMGPLRPLQLLAATTLGTLTAAPAAAHAVPATATVAETAAQNEQEEKDQPEQDPAEPFVVERSAVVDAFGYDSADLTSDMAQDLAATVQLIDQHGAPELPIVVTGHTDAAGDPDYNTGLSERRADAVEQELRTHLGEDADIEVHGEGDRALLEGATDAEQRRVEISYSVVVTPPPPEEPGEDAPGHGEQDAEEQQAPAVGLSLPGGLILAMTAGAAGVVAGMAAERRTGRPTATGEDDADEDRHEPEAVAMAASANPPRTDTEEAPGPELALIDLARVPGVGITGLGANGGARTLVARSLDAAESELNVVVAEGDLRALLDQGQRLPQLSEDAPVVVTETVDDALTLLQLQVLAHHRAADEHDDDEPQEARAPGPQFVLLAQAEAAVAAEVTSLLAHTEGAPLSAVLLGPWPTPDGPTLTLNEHGAITAAEAPLAEITGHAWPGTAPGPLHRKLMRHHDAPTPAAPAHAEPDQSRHTKESAEPVQSTDFQESAEPQHEHAPEPGQASTDPPAEEEEAPPPPGAVQVTVLGSITLAVHGHQVRPHRQTAFEVLAYLAAHPAGVRLEAAAEDMWPEQASHRGIRRFHDACTALRSACRPALGEAATGLITHGGEMYRLNPALVACDLWRLDDLLDQAAQADDGPVLATSAASLLDAGFAAQADYRWAEAIRVSIRNRIVEALTDYSADVGVRQAISMLRRALNIDPTADRAARALAQRYEEKGDTKSAQRVLKDRAAVLESAE
ncbi:hypothetical protein GCM10027590_32320 [Nocardiopsis nanhaiensis]